MEANNTQSESVKGLLKAFDKFQEQCPVITKNAKNPFTKSSYADYPHIVETVRPYLRDNGLVITDINLNGNSSFDMRNGDEVVNHVLITIKTTLHHLESGEWMSSTLSLPLKQANAQEGGSAITYARRYNLVTLLGLTTEDDDDGNSASNKKEVKSVQPKEEAKKKPVTPVILGYSKLKEKLTGKAQTKKALDDAFDMIKKSVSYGKLTEEEKEKLNTDYENELFVIQQGGKK